MSADIIEHSLLLSCEDVPRVIGHQGATIKQIRMKSGARVNTDRVEVPGRPGQQEMRFSGTPTQVETAIALVNEALTQPPPQQAALAQPAAPCTQLAESGLVEKQLVFPIEAVTRIIGVQGANIKQIRAASGARVNTERNSTVPGMPGHQTVRFDGTSAQVEMAVAMVHDILAKSGVSTSATTPTLSSTPAAQQQQTPSIRTVAQLDGSGSRDTMQKSLAVPREMITRIIGAQGMTIKHIRSASGCRINTDRDMSVPGNPGQQEMRFEGTEQQVEMAILMVREVLANAQADGATAAPPQHTTASTYARGSGAASSMQVLGSLSGAMTPVTDATRVEKTITIPSEAVTKLIGPAGAHIKQIRAQSGARINTDRQGGTQQSVHFAGSEPQVLAAVEMTLQHLQAEVPELMGHISMGSLSGAGAGGGANAILSQSGALGYGGLGIDSALMQLGGAGLSPLTQLAQLAQGGHGMALSTQLTQLGQLQGGLGLGQISPMLSTMSGLDAQLSQAQQQQLLLNNGAMMASMLAQVDTTSAAPTAESTQPCACSAYACSSCDGASPAMPSGVKRGMDALAPTMVHEASHNGSCKLRRTEQPSD
uniref:K Homology domain-containing protein n=1 Tax=Calcidiscus leptoporus TaxID=127549 RepID=A0A7S0IUZ3_9EUKA|mmetsp:Transcript_23244/g.53772  ORF Transcript_23244/g.53772 Transcript_23244/m.53772 type:complete len:595 (+) Transcript_23244:162-1946(+)|eukprot:CAMPEP_0119373722 /NCGR_PEP_ID=MMETSP1334-20130426/27433_1 /TAXON_ID=127549 /ORGANISM="Calcidiscus leptoporus, Strain RCC1130" /LENGTH=594 /DNA_ID=CAMNT_0007391581 /DNA_START=162 /DNA_END=1946 /DNA_ORIENTATION=+